ncbi:MAG: hypothetical protein Q7Q73_02275 [Verrucomicrobiota bacterium JB024]|nr:hypothetical protein [Verrucomicrobiota bacterium JB024]
MAGTSRQGKPYHLQKTTLLCGKQVVVITDAKRGDGPIPEVPKEGQSCRFTIEPSMEDKGILNLNGRMLEG